MSRRTQDRTSRTIPGPATTRRDLLERERGTYLKKWTGRLPVALFYPNSYHVGMSSLGFQIVYRLLNDYEHIVCERLFLPDTDSALLSVESGRSPDNFPILFCSVSFEQDYVNLASFFLASGLEPLGFERALELFSRDLSLLHQQQAERRPETELALGSTRPPGDERAQALAKALYRFVSFCLQFLKGRDGLV